MKFEVWNLKFDKRSSKSINQNSSQRNCFTRVVIAHLLQTTRGVKYISSRKQNINVKNEIHKNTIGFWLHAKIKQWTLSCIWNHPKWCLGNALSKALRRDRSVFKNVFVFSIGTLMALLRWIWPRQDRAPRAERPHCPWRTDVRTLRLGRSSCLAHSRSSSLCTPSNADSRRFPVYEYFIYYYTNV